MNFREWLAQVDDTGNISPVKLGMTRSELSDLFGVPADVGAYSQKYKLPQIWRYEQLEFHFGPKLDDGLLLIYEEEPEGVVRLAIPKRGTGAT